MANGLSRDFVNDPIGCAVIAILAIAIALTMTIPLLHEPSSNDNARIPQHFFVVGKTAANTGQNEINEWGPFRSRLSAEECLRELASSGAFSSGEIVERKTEESGK